MKKIFHRFEIWSEKKSPNAQKGATLVEFSIIALVLFTLLFAIIEFGVYLYNQQVITNASREGARAGIVSRIPRRSAAEVTDKVNDYCQTYLVTFGDANSPDIDIRIVVYDPDTGNPSTINDPDSDDLELVKFGDELEVIANFEYGSLFLPFMPDEIQGQSVMKYE